MGCLVFLSYLIEFINSAKQFSRSRGTEYNTSETG